MQIPLQLTSLLAEGVQKFAIPTAETGLTAAHFYVGGKVFVVNSPSVLKEASEQHGTVIYADGLGATAGRLGFVIDVGRRRKGK